MQAARVTPVVLVFVMVFLLMIMGTSVVLPYINYSGSMLKLVTFPLFCGFAFFDKPLRDYASLFDMQ